MQTLAEFLQFLPQCCDANTYLRLGQACAETGQCYDEQRPMGAVYWFSLPFRFGYPASIWLISAHLLLAAISIVLSVNALRKFFQLHRTEFHKQILSCLLILIISLVSHAVFLYPTIQVSLSDAPASLLALIAIWLLLINTTDNSSTHTARRLLTYTFAALCLGLAVWIRLLYLYPTLFVLFVWFCIWLRNKKRDRIEIVLLIALLPISAQVFATWYRSGSISYLDPQMTEKLLVEHRDNKSIGYDMVLESRGIWNWYSDSAENQP